MTTEGALTRRPCGRVAGRCSCTQLDAAVLPAQASRTPCQAAGGQAAALNIPPATVPCGPPFPAHCVFFPCTHPFGFFATHPLPLSLCSAVLNMMRLLGLLEETQPGRATCKPPGPKPPGPPPRCLCFAACLNVSAAICRRLWRRRGGPTLLGAMQVDPNRLAHTRFQPPRRAPCLPAPWLFGAAGRRRRGGAAPAGWPLGRPARA